MIKVYLSGKMTGLPKEEYTALFSRAESFYKNAGFDVINPVVIGEELLKKKPKAGYEDFMKADLKALKGCSHIDLLENWETSPGANREKEEAERLGLEVMHLRFFNKI